MTGEKWSPRAQRAFIRDQRKRSPLFDAEWRREAPARRKGNLKAYRQAHPENGRTQGQRRRAKEAEAPGNGFSANEWKRALLDYAGRCAYCGDSGKLQIEHVEPISRGGAHDADNIVPACRACNSSKHARTLVVWLAMKAGARRTARARARA